MRKYLHIKVLDWAQLLKKTEIFKRSGTEKISKIIIFMGKYSGIFEIYLEGVLYIYPEMINKGIRVTLNIIS